MNAEGTALEAATIRQQCKVLHLPSVAAQCAQLAEQAVRERRTDLGYLEALLQTELEDREQRLIERRIREARLPRMKTLEEFDFSRNPKISAQQIHELARSDYIAKAEPIIFIGDSGTGKTHLLTGLVVAALPAEAAGAIRDRRGTDQRTGRGRASAAARPRPGALDPLRSDCTR
jgi:DNA replication protein DnaC